MSDKYIQINKAATFRQVVPRSVQMPQPPRFMFGDVPAGVLAHYFSSVVLHPIGNYAGTGFELSDGYILHADGKLVSGGDIKLHPATLDGIDAKREAAFGERPRQRINSVAALIISPGYRIYGHWLADILPRLAVLEADSWNLDDVIFPVPHDIPAWGLEMMTLAGVPRSQILVVKADEVIKADQLVIPTLLHNGVRYSPLLANAVALFKRGLAKAGHNLVGGTGRERLLVARATDNRRLNNREQIVAMAEAAGFVSIRPETMSLPEQFALFAGAREVLGEYGSAIHTALFSPPGTAVCGLRGSDNHPGFLQSGMGDVLGHATGYVFGQTGGGPGRYDYTVEEKAFVNCLRLAFGPHAHFALQRPAAPVEKPAEVAPPLRGYRKPPHQAEEARVPAWQFWRKPRGQAARPEAGSLYADLWKDEDK